jgi:hypothetical protein
MDTINIISHNISLTVKRDLYAGLGLEQPNGTVPLHSGYDLTVSLFYSKPVTMSNSKLCPGIISNPEAFLIAGLLIARPEAQIKIHAIRNAIVCEGGLFD